MTAAGTADGNRAQELGQRLLLDWRVRCGLRRCAVEATSSPQAMALCVAVSRTLRDRSGGPELALAACTWSSGVASSAEARAALLCLCDVAAEAGTTTVEGLPAHALDIVLEQLAIVAAPAPDPAALPAPARHDVDPLTGCRGRRAFEADLDDHVALAKVAGRDVSVVLAELAPRKAKARRGTRLALVPDDVVVLGLVATLRRATGSPRPLYRLSEHRFALLLPGTSRVRAGELMLVATCGSGPAFDWGAGSLAGAGARAGDDSGVVTMLADADLHIRRRDLVHATHELARKRKASVVTAATAAVALLGGSAFAFEGGSPGGLPQAALGASHAVTQVPGGAGALHARLRTPPAPDVTVPAPATTVPAPLPAPAPGLAPATDVTVPVAQVSSPPSAQTVARIVPSPPATAVPPVPVPPVAAPPVTVPVPAPTPVPPVTTPTPPADQPPNLLLLVSGLLHEAKHAVPWFKGHHAERA
ncbi:MAG TPA: hypothetical protein VMU09_07295 [Acidimicrobiales bacterium]|nr:hypothetical protein [Acidimicrobiales bacterium]